MEVAQARRRAWQAFLAGCVVWAPVPVVELWAPHAAGEAFIVPGLLWLFFASPGLTLFYAFGCLASWNIHWSMAVGSISNGIGSSALLLGEAALNGVAYALLTTGATVVRAHWRARRVRMK